MMTDGKSPKAKETSSIIPGPELNEPASGAKNEALKKLVETQEEELKRIGKTAAQAFTDQFENDPGVKIAAKLIEAQNKAFSEALGPGFRDHVKTLEDTIGASTTIAAHTISALNTQASALSSMFTPSRAFSRLGENLISPPSTVELPEQPWSALSAARR